MAVGNGNPKHKWQSHNSILKKGNSVTKASGKVSFSRSASVSSCWVMISPLYYSVKMQPRLGCIIGWNWPKGEERNQIAVWSSFTQRGRRSGSCGGDVQMFRCGRSQDTERDCLSVKHSSRQIFKMDFKSQTYVRIFLFFGSRSHLGDLCSPGCGTLEPLSSLCSHWYMFTPHLMTLKSLLSLS